MQDVTVEYIIPENEQVVVTPIKPNEKYGRVLVELSDKLLVTRNPELKYTHYINGASDRINFEMYLSFEARELVKKFGWKNMRAMFEENLAQIDKDPYSINSLDPDRTKHDAQVRRTINPISQKFEDILGIPIVIKGSGILLPPRTC